MEAGAAFFSCFAHGPRGEKYAAFYYFNSFCAGFASFAVASVAVASVAVASVASVASVAVASVAVVVASVSCGGLQPAAAGSYPKGRGKGGGVPLVPFFAYRLSRRYEYIRTWYV